MQNTRHTPGPGNNVVVLGTTSKTSRGKNKRSSLIAPQQDSSSSDTGGGSGRRRKSVPSEWEHNIGCNIRVDARHHQKLDITMPEIHHANSSSMPVPLNTIMKGWDNVPKLYQYKPSQLQVVYHRRTGENEVGDPVPPEPTKPPPECRCDPMQLKALGLQPRVSSSPSSYMDSPSTSSLPYNDIPFQDFDPIPNGTEDHLYEMPEPVIPEDYIHYFTDTSESVQDDPWYISSRNEMQQQEQLIADARSTHSMLTRTVESQTETNPTNISCQTEIYGKPAQCQTDKDSSRNQTMSSSGSRKSTFTTSSSQTHNMPSGAMIMKESDINHRQPKYQTTTATSQTEPLKLISSQSISISTQIYQDDFESEEIQNKTTSITNKSIINQCTGTETINFKEVSVQVDQVLERVVLEDCGSQTEIDIETPKICLECDFKQLQMEELEENMAELQERFKTMEKNQKEKELLVQDKTQWKDSSTNTDEEIIASLPTPIPEEDETLSNLKVDDHNDTKYLKLEQENEQLKLTIETLKIKLNTFHNGFKSLRTAIDKPIVVDNTNVTEETIQEVLNKAEDFITNCSNSQSRAKKINDHLTVLNTCVSVANGVLNETPTTIASTKPY